MADLIKTVWENILQPAIDWIAQHIMPAVAPVIEAMGNLFIDTFKEIGERLDGFVTAARGVVQFLTGVFSGDWDKAWNGIKKVFHGIWDALPSAITTPIETAGNALTSFLSNHFVGGCFPYAHKSTFENWIQVVFGVTVKSFHHERRIADFSATKLSKG